MNFMIQIIQIGVGMSTPRRKSKDRGHMVMEVQALL